MQAEQWKEIEKLFEASIELEPGQRADFLAEACANDQIRRKVELLLAARGKEPSFIERPALDLAAEIVMHSNAESRVGLTIEQYQVLSVIGAGGMGVVYRARDTKLGRDLGTRVLKSARPTSSHVAISSAVPCLQKLTPTRLTATPLAIRFTDL